MFLNSLSGTTVPLGQGSPGSQAEAAARAECARSGGVFSSRPLNYRPGPPQAEPPIDAWYCVLPEPAPGGGAGNSAPITVNTSTQVSPQISPSFVQQQQPTGSPVTTGAGQDQSNRTAPPTVVQVPAYMPASSTTDATDASQSVTLPTPLGPSVVPLDTFKQYAPWLAVGIIAFAAWYSKRRGK